jgi:hypothetical protein
LLYGLLFIGINFRRSRVYRVFLAIFLAFLCADIGYWVYHARFNKSLRVTILDAGRADVALIQFPGSERMLLARNAFTHRGFDLGRIVVAPYLWQGKIKRFDYLLLTDPQLPPTDKLRFMTDNFRPREVLSHLSGERVIAGVRIRGESGGGTRVSYRGWSFLFRDQKVLVENEDLQRGKEGPRYIITTGEQKKSSSPFPVLSTHETGALTITIDTEGAMKMESFLKKDLPFRDVEALQFQPGIRVQRLLQENAGCFYVVL